MKVLTTTDGSARSLQALPHAARLARSLGAEVVLARVLDPRIDAGDELATKLGDAVERVSARWTEELAAALAAAGVPGRPLVGVRGRSEPAPDCILRLAAEQQADVLAMSTRSSGVVRHAIFGSVALGVLSKTSLPVLVSGDHIADPASDGAYHLLITSDGSPDAVRAVDAALPLAQQPEIRVTLLRIDVPRVGDRGEAAEAAAARDDLERLRMRFPDPGSVECLVRPITQLGGVDTAILNTAEEIGASAIAMSTHGHSAKYHVFAGSTALGILRQSRLPVLLVRSSPAPS